MYKGVNNGRSGCGSRVHSWKTLRVWNRLSEDGTCSGSPRGLPVVWTQPGGGPVPGVLLGGISEGVYHPLTEEELLEGIELYTNCLTYQKLLCCYCKSINSLCNL